METGATAVVGRGLVEILPDFRKWGKQLASDMKIAGQQIRGQMAVPEGAVRDSMGRLRDANGRFIREYENGWRGATATVGKSMAKIGKGTTALGIGVAAVSVKMAADFQSETAVLQTAAGESVKGLAVVREGIKNIAVGTGTGIKNLTDGMYTIEKAGFRGANGLQILKAAAQGAKEENANLADVTNAMTSVMASYHLKADKSVQVMNAMKTAAGEGKITMEEFSGALSTVLPIASANKISFQDVAGSMATLTQHGTSAREATHELAATIRALASPNQVASREMARFGLDANDVSTKLGKRGLSGTVDMLVETILGKMGPAGTRLQKIFEGTKQSGTDAQVMLKNMTGAQKQLAEQYLKGNMIQEDWNSTLKGMPVSQAPALRNFKVLVDRSRGFSRELKNGGPSAQTFTDALKKMSGGAIGLNTILQITGESSAGNAERIKKVGESFRNNSKDVEGWKVTAGLLNTQIARMKAQFQVLAINIGTKLIPIVSLAVGFFAEHKQVLMGVVIAIGVFIAATSAAYIATKAWAAATRVASAAQALATGVLWAYNVATGSAEVGIVGLRIQLMALAVQEKVVAVWTAITESAFWGLAAAILANPITWIVVAVVALVAGIYLLATRTRFFQTVWSATWGFVKKVFTAFTGWFKKNWQLITFTIMTLGIGLAVAMIVRHWKSVKKAFADAFNWVKANWPLLLAIITGPIGMAVYLVTKYWSQISDGARTAYHATINWFVAMGKDIGHFFTSTLPGFFKALPGQVSGFFKSAGGAAADFGKTAGAAIGNFFTSLPGKLAGWGKSFYQANLDAGKQLISGLIDGAETFFTKQIPQFFKFLWHGLVDYFKAVFGIHSPSTVFASMGGDLILGMLQGMLRIAATLGAWMGTHIFTPVNNFFKNAGTWLYSHGRNVVLGFIRGNLIVASTLATWLNAHIYRPMVNFFGNAVNWLVSGGRAVIRGLVNGAQNWWANESSWWTGRGKAIAAYFSGAVGWLAASGRNVINGLLSGMKSVWKDLTGWVSGIAKWIKDHKGPISLDSRLLTPAGRALMSGLLKGLKFGFKDVGSFIYGTGDSIADVVGKLKGLFSSGLGAVGLGSSKGVSKFRDLVDLALRMLGQPTGFEGLVLKRMNQESGGNPGIVNTWDSNWKAGHPSVGLMQVIRGTFQAYAGKYRNTGPFKYGVSTNPMANIYAGLNYALHRYGSLAALGRPGGYDLGGIASGAGFLRKGTLKPERVLSPRQTVAFENLVGALSGPARNSGGGGGGITIDKLVIENHGVIASKQEAEDWLVAAMVTLKRKNRLPS